jgi:hypothetical protein
MNVEVMNVEGFDNRLSNALVTENLLSVLDQFQGQVACAVIPPSRVAM